MRLRLAKDYACDVCGKAFQAKRRAWLCSAKCRQVQSRDLRRRSGSVAWGVVR